MNNKIEENQRDTIILRQINQSENPVCTDHDCISTNEWQIESKKSIHKLLDYFTTHTVQYKSSGMMLRAHSDVLYFYE